MAATYPGIQAIAKAFEADPRTRLANTMMATGASTAPVAGGSWAWVDGLARALQGGIGGYVSKQQLKKYGAEQDKLTAGGQQTGAEGLAAMAPPPQAPMPPQAPVMPPQAPQAPPAMAAPLAPQQPPQALGKIDPNEVMAALGAKPPAPSMAPNAMPPMPGEISGYGGGTFDMAGKQVTPTQRGVVFADPLGGKGGPVSSGYGPRKAPVKGASTMHTGIDIPVAEGSPVLPAAPGRVIAAWNDTKNGGGLSVRVRHADGSVTGYAHLSALNVQQGQEVDGSTPIGAAGKTGKATGSHLHFTVRDPSGKRVDPSKIEFGTAGGVPTPASTPPATGRPPVAGVEPELEVPDAMARPDAPEAEGATKSPKLIQAYKMLQRGNPYEYDKAMAMLEEGLAEQGNFEERATGRKQSIKDTTYQSDLGMFANDRQTRLQDTLTGNREIRGRNFQVADREDGQSFTAEQNAAERAARIAEAERDRAFRREQASLDRNQQLQLTLRQIEASAATREEKALAKQNAFYQSPEGRKDLEAFEAASKSADQMNTLLGEFEVLNKDTDTGGMWNAYTPNAIQGFTNKNTQRMINIGDQLAQTLTKTLPGALSNADLEFLRGIVPSVTSKRDNNTQNIRYFRNAANRQAEYATARTQSRINGDRSFPTKWRAYTQAVPLKDADKITFEEFSSAPTVNFGK
jgi:murein DD-endopeptidase MepM/ murein hydrolase activator NlpD